MIRKGWTAVAAAWLGTLGLWAAAGAGTCIDGGCHQEIVSTRYLHGPVAAEELGVEGCVSCHVPAGAPCTASAAGRYRFKTKEERLCLLCHERGTGTRHTQGRSKCLSCHSPHGSDSGTNLMRAG
ncbi:MAG: hypothetical protein Kow0092_04550 [Deferrisomatales bacterium]